MDITHWWYWKWQSNDLGYETKLKDNCADFVDQPYDIFDSMTRLATFKTHITTHFTHILMVLTIFSTKWMGMTTAYTTLGFGSWRPIPMVIFGIWY